jgi:Flp pilus assembly protein TadG
MAKHFVDTLRQRLWELRTATGANVTITFALATIPLVGFVGAAVDYSHANAVKAALQSATDATGLMLSKTAASLTESQLKTKAGEYMNALFVRPDANGLLVSANYIKEPTPKVTVNAETTVNTHFMGIMGFTKLKVSAESQVKWGNTKLRVALALDTTGSMASDGKMTALKKAGKALIDQLKAAAMKDGDVYVAIVPFNKDVNVGKTKKDETWIKWSGENDTYFDVNGNCTGYGSGSKPKTKSACNDKGGTWTPVANKDGWEGCVMDRTQSYDTTNTAPSTAVQASLFPAEKYADCPKRMLELTYDWDALKNKIDELEPVGNTNQGIGIAWGFQALTAAPFVIPPKDPLYKYTEVIILMSDGLNTQNRWTSNQTQIDAREAITCTNAKAAGITIYAVQVNTGGDPTQMVLKNCASSADKFFELKSANQLVSTFNQIGTALSNLRIAQ